MSKADDIWEKGKIIPFAPQYLQEICNHWEYVASSLYQNSKELEAKLEAAEKESLMMRSDYKAAITKLNDLQESNHDAAMDQKFEDRD